MYGDRACDADSRASGTYSYDADQLALQRLGWGKCLPLLCQHAHWLCYGLNLSAEVFNRAIIQGVPFSTTKTGGKKRFRESVVLMTDNSTY